MASSGELPSETKHECGLSNDASVRSPRTTSNTALLQQVSANEAVFEILAKGDPPGTEHLKGGVASEAGKVHPEHDPGSATQAGLSGLIRGRWRDLAGGAVSKKNMITRIESAALLKGHRLVLKTIIYNPSGLL